MRAKAQPQKVETVNPNTGRRMNLDKEVYDLFSAAIAYTLQKSGPLTFTQITEGVNHYFQEQQIDFGGSIEWYAVSVKNDLQSRGVIEAYMEKGRKLHKLKGM